MHKVTVVATILLGLKESAVVVYHVTQKLLSSFVLYNHFIQMTITPISSHEIR